MFKPATPRTLFTLLLAICTPACGLFKSDSADSTVYVESAWYDSQSTSTCGWDAGGSNAPHYSCYGSGEDPDGIYPIECPAGLSEGDPCMDDMRGGCCDELGNAWYCEAYGGIGFLTMTECS